MKSVLVRMLDKQLEFLGLPAKWAAAKGGVGSGKTMAMVWWMIRRLETYPEANHVVVGADYDQLRRGFFQSLVGVLEEDLGWELGQDFHYRENPTPLIRFLHNGARLRAMSAELAQRVRSAEFQSVYCEEPQTWHNGNGADTFRAVANRLRHSRKSAVVYPKMTLKGRMTFNPPAIGSWLYDLIEKQWVQASWPCLTFSLRDNILLPGQQEYIQQVESMYPPDRWPVEIEGEWSTFGGMVYRYYDAKVHAAPAPAGLPPKELWAAPILWAHDFNVHKMCSVVCQQVTQKQISLGYQAQPQGPPREAFRNTVEGWQKRVLYAHDEIVLTDAGTPDVVAEFLKRYGDHARKHGVYLYGDPSAGRGQSIASAAAVKTAWDDIITSLRNSGIRLVLRVHSDSPSPGDRVNTVNAQFLNRDGFGFLVNGDKCTDLTNDFRLVTYKEGTNDIDKISNKALTHCFAAGTLIETSDGEVPIEAIHPGAQVLTRAGFRTVLAAGLTRRKARVVLAEFSNGASFIATPDHRVFDPSIEAFQKLSDCHPGGTVLSRIEGWSQKSSTVGDTSVGVVGTIGERSAAWAHRSHISTGTFGQRRTAQSRKGITFIMSMATEIITRLIIWNAFLLRITAQSIVSKTGRGASNALNRDNLIGCESSPSLGIVRQKVASGIADMLWRLSWSLTPQFAFSAASVSKQNSLRHDSAAATARCQRGAGVRSTMKPERAPFAASLSGAISTFRPKHAVANVVRISESGHADVYDLTVDGAPEFYANGILVHNSSDALGYLIYVERMLARSPGSIKFKFDR